MQRSVRLFAAAAIAGATFFNSASAQTSSSYPSKPITTMIGYTAGGLTDVMTRTLVERMSQELGQTVIVDNKPGAATSIASASVAQANPDGYTLLMGTTSLAINPALQPKLEPRDPITSLEPVGTAYFTPFTLLVRSDLPVNSLEEFVDYARQNAGKLSVASSGVGAVNHLLLELFKKEADVDLMHVPYKGASQALIDLRGGRIDATFATPLDAVPVAQTGDGRILAVTSAQPIDLLPDVPTVASTYPGVVGVFWQGLFAPAGTPVEVRDRLAAALRVATTDAALKESAAGRGVVFMPGGPEELRKQLADETVMWGQIIRDAQIQAQ